MEPVLCLFLLLSHSILALLSFSLDCVTKLLITKKELEMVKEEAAIILEKINQTFSHSHSLGQSKTVHSTF